MMRLKAASPTGSTGLGQQSEAEGTALKSTDANLDVRQGRDQLQRQINLARQAAIENTPGIHPSNPIDLATMAPRDIPDGAFFRGPDGKVYQQQHGAGWPKVGAAPAPTPRDQANTTLKAKSARTRGAPVLLGYE
jgi:hypothetical protein